MELSHEEKEVNKMLFYTGLKVKVKNENILYGYLLNEYKRLGYLCISQIFENGNVFLSNNPNGGLSISMNTNALIPIYDENILTVLQRKKDALYNLKKEINDIKNFINERCKN